MKPAAATAAMTPAETNNTGRFRCFKLTIRGNTSVCGQAVEQEIKNVADIAFQVTFFVTHRTEFNEPVDETEEQL